MALSFQWDEIAFRKATAGWKPMPTMIYARLIPWLHINDGSVTDAQLEIGHRDFGVDPKTWRKWIAFLKEQGKLVRTQSGEWTNGRVAVDHERITRRRSATVGDEPRKVGDETQKNPEQYSTESTTSAPPLQVTGIQGTEIQDTGNKNARARATPSGFDAWWFVYPHKVGKQAAAKSFVKARRSVDLETLIAGVERYKAMKPPDRPWCNPATWLNQGRWEDEEGPGIACQAKTPQQSAVEKMMEIANERQQGHGPAFGADQPASASATRAGQPEFPRLVSDIRGNSVRFRS